MDYGNHVEHTKIFSEVMSSVLYEQNKKALQRWT